MIWDEQQAEKGLAPSQISELDIKRLYMLNKVEEYARLSGAGTGGGALRFFGGTGTPPATTSGSKRPTYLAPIEDAARAILDGKGTEEEFASKYDSESLTKLQKALEIERKNRGTTASTGVPLDVVEQQKVTDEENRIIKAYMDKYNVSRETAVSNLAAKKDRATGRFGTPR